jgi:hypothetical protein
VLELMAQYPLYGLVQWDVRPVLEFREGLDTVRGKLVEAQAAMSGAAAQGPATSSRSAGRRRRSGSPSRSPGTARPWSP